MTDTREMIERALGKVLWRAIETASQRGEISHLDRRDAVIDCLAEQAIVVPVEVEHIPGYDAQGHSDWVTCLRGYSPLVDGYLDIDGMKGTPGKAIAIIVSLGEGDESTRD